MTPPTWRAVYLEAAAQHLRAAVGAGRERVTVRTSATWWPRSERGVS